MRCQECIQRVWRIHAAARSAKRFSDVLFNLSQVDDTDIAGGAMLTERLRIYIPTGEGGAIITLDRFVWGDDVFKWGADIFRGQSRDYVNESGALLRAAFDDAVADRIDYGGTDFVIEESRSWPSHTRATALRQT